MRKRSVGALVAVATLLVVTAIPAYAAFSVVRVNTVADPDVDQEVTAYLKQDKTSFKCGGENYYTKTFGTPYATQASYVCQYQKSDGTWVDFPNGEQIRRQDSVWSGLGYTTANNVCSSRDGAPSLSGSNIKIRAQADGFVRLSFVIDAFFKGPAAMHTETVSINCK